MNENSRLWRGDFLNIEPKNAKKQKSVISMFFEPRIKESRIYNILEKFGSEPVELRKLSIFYFSGYRTLKLKADKN